jgi:hypothetical protein
MAEPWSDAALDAMRELGDPALDEAVRDHVARNGPSSLLALFGAPPGTGGGEHPLLLAVSPPRPEELGDRATIERGQRLFSLFGPEIMLALGSYSLPLTYASGNGVQVISRTDRLGTDPRGRLRNTARMVAQVMIPGSLEPGKIGWKSARKVRLVHAIARHQVQSLREPPWRPEWGVAINQEDQAGTLLTFSVAVLHAIRRLGARFSRDEADAYVAAWAGVGLLLGVRPELLVRTEAEGLALSRRIAERQVRPTVEGRELTGALLRMSDGGSPLRGSANAWLHYFFRDAPLGDDVLSALGVPPPNWTRWTVKLSVLQKRAFFTAMDRLPWGRQGRSLLSRFLLDRLFLAET